MRGPLARIGIVVALVCLVAPQLRAQPPSFIIRWGGPGSGPGQFHEPWSVAVDGDGEVFVGEWINGTSGRIQKFTSGGEYITQWANQAGSGASAYAVSGLAVDAAGRVLVASPDDGVLVFDNAGTYIAQWELRSGGLGIGVDAGGYAYVWRGTTVAKFTSDGSFVTEWATGASGDFGGIAVDGAGHVYVAVAAANRISKYASDGTFLTEWGTTGSGNGQLSNVSGIATDHDGNVYAVDNGNYRVQVFSSDGAYLTQWGTQGFGDGQFSNPIGIAVDASGEVYVSDGDTIQKFGRAVTVEARSWSEVKALFR